MGCTWMGNVCTCCRKYNDTNVVQQSRQKYFYQVNLDINGNTTDLQKAINYVKQGGGNNDLTKLIELKFSCKNLPNLDTVTLTDAMCVVQLESQQHKGLYRQIGRTQIINDNLNPIFVKSINVPYHFELPKRLKVSVYDVDDFGKNAPLKNHDFVGQVELLLHDIIGAPNQELELPLINPKRKKTGTILIQAFEIETKPDHRIKMTMRASNITNRGRIFFYLLKPSQKEGQFVRVFKSELQSRDQYNTIHWNIVEILSSSLANYDFNMELKFELWQAQKSGRHIFLGFYKNQYVKAIKSVGQILQCYDSDKKIPVFGYGAKVPGFDKVSHCFALNGNIFDPQVDGIDGVIDCYKQNAKKLQFYGPTYFSQILKEAVDFAQYQKVSQFNQSYYILLMITDGQINDMDKSIDQIVRGSSLPLSIIIVGVGNSDFGNMNMQARQFIQFNASLDADQTPLYSKTLRKQMQRDIVQFVPFSQFKNDVNQLTKQTLEQIPGQIVSFFQSKGIVPLDKTQQIGNVPYIPPANQIGMSNNLGQQIPSYFTEKKIEFLEYLSNVGFHRENLEKLLHYGIPCQSQDLVRNVINYNYENSLLMRQHQQRGRMSIAKFKKGPNRQQSDEAIAAQQIRVNLR